MSIPEKLLYLSISYAKEMRSLPMHPPPRSSVITIIHVCPTRARLHVSDNNVNSTSLPYVYSRSLLDACTCRFSEPGPQHDETASYCFGGERGRRRRRLPLPKRLPDGDTPSIFRVSSVHRGVSCSPVNFGSSAACLVYSRGVMLRRERCAPFFFRVRCAV